mgnify:CR=1 FL=1
MYVLLYHDLVFINGIERKEKLNICRTFKQIKHFVKEVTKKTNLQSEYSSIIFNKKRRNSEVTNDADTKQLSDFLTKLL